MTHHWDTYMQETQITCTSLTRIRDILYSLNLTSSLVDQVNLLMRGVVRKDKSLASDISFSSLERVRVYAL